MKNCLLVLSISQYSKLSRKILKSDTYHGGESPNELIAHRAEHYFNYDNDHMYYSQQSGENTRP